MSEAPMYRFDRDLAPFAGAFPPADLEQLDETRLAVAAAVADRVTDWTGVDVEECVVTGAGHAVPVAVYRPTSGGERVPVLLYFHGGGFVLADHHSDDPLLTRIVRQTGISVVSVDYRLAPEHPCPAALDDGLAALAWCSESAATLGFTGLAIGGRSAGAALAAGVALGRPAATAVDWLYLGEPVLDPRLTTPSMTTMDDAPVWRRRDAVASWQLYLGGRSLDDLPAYAAPATHPELAVLPPTYITANEIDPLRDEALAFAGRLFEAGVPTELHVYPGTFHGAMSFDAPVAARMQADLIAAIRRGLALRPG